MQPDAAITDLALTFARALVSGDFAAAHRLLTPELALETSADNLRGEYELMTSYWDGPPDTVQVGQVLPPPESNGVPDGLAWVFVDIDRRNGPGGAELECVGVLIVAGSSALAISQLVWGRP